MAMNISESTERQYALVLRTLSDLKVPLAVGGAWAVNYYTRLGRSSLDLDLMLDPLRVDQALGALTSLGGKLIDTDVMQARVAMPIGEVDLVHHFAQGEYAVDSAFIQRGVPARLFDTATLITAPDDLIWTKVFIASRYRFDGADVVHLLRATHDRLNWKRLQGLLAPFPPLLMAYLNLYAFVYPDCRNTIPDWLWNDLFANLQTPVEPTEPKICRGPLLDSHHFEFDLVAKGFMDVREAAGPSALEARG